MLEIACVAGLLIFNTTAFNPDNINSINLNDDYIHVDLAGRLRRWHRFEVETEKEAKEAWEYSLEAWRKCKKEWK